MAGLSQQSVRAVRSVTLWGMLANIVLASVKFAVGVLAGSQALVADAVHSLSDCVTDFVVLLGSAFWAAPADEDHPHGHGRIETFVTLLIGVALAAVGIGLAYNALATLEEADRKQPGWPILFAALLSIGVKEWLYRWTIAVGRRERSSALAANAWHHRSDAFSSIPVVVVAIVSMLAPSWTFVDHVAAVLIGVLILQASLRIAWPAFQQLIDRGASRSLRERIATIAKEIEGVQDLHALRTRHIGTGYQVDLHVLVDAELTVRQGHSIAVAVKAKLIQELPSVMDVLIHVEPHKAPESYENDEDRPRDGE